MLTDKENLAYLLLYLFGLEDSDKYDFDVGKMSWEKWPDKARWLRGADTLMMNGWTPASQLSQARNGALEALKLSPADESNAYHNLGGAILDIERNKTCDEVSMRTLKRVEKQLGAAYAAFNTAAMHAQQSANRDVLLWAEKEARKDQGRRNAFKAMYDIQHLGGSWPSRDWTIKALDAALAAYRLSTPTPVAEVQEAVFEFAPDPDAPSAIACEAVNRLKAEIPKLKGVCVDDMARMFGVIQTTIESYIRSNPQPQPARRGVVDREKLKAWILRCPFICGIDVEYFADALLSSGLIHAAPTRGEIQQAVSAWESRVITGKNDIPLADAILALHPTGQE